jgi:putative oxidoreductase
MSIDQASDSSANASGIFTALFNNVTVDAATAKYGIFVLRVAIGVDWIAHAFLKISRA